MPSALCFLRRVLERNASGGIFDSRILLE